MHRSESLGAAGLFSSPVGGGGPPEGWWRGTATAQVPPASPLHHFVVPLPLRVRRESKPAVRLRHFGCLRQARSDGG